MDAMKFKSYEELQKVVLKNCLRDDEKARVQEEFNLFKARGWEKYIVFLCNVLPYIGLTREPMGPNGSVMDSYAIYKSWSENYNYNSLYSERNREVLFNDALRLDENFVYLSLVLEEVLRKLDHSIELNCQHLGLYKKELMIDKAASAIGKELIVISQTPISDADLAIIMNEKKESTEEEKKVLHKYLIITLQAFVGL